MRFAVLLATALVGMSPAHAVSETAEGFAAAMQGCWNEVGGRGSTSLQLCLDGGTEGTVGMLGCHTNTKTNLTDCWTEDGQYAFRDEKFWRTFGGPWSTCDVLIESSTRFILQNCLWIDPPPDLGPIENAVYEKAIGQ